MRVLALGAVLATLVAVAAVVELVAVGSAPADKPVGLVRDPDDTAGPLDLAAASAQIRTRGTRRKRSRSLLLRLRTHEPWEPRDVVRGGGLAPDGFTFEFAAAGTGQRCLDIRIKPDGTLVGLMRLCYPIRHGEIGPAIGVHRRGLRQAQAVVPLRLLGRGGVRARWRAISSYEADGEPACPTPDYPPPEHLYGRCVDSTRWARLARPSR